MLRPGPGRRAAKAVTGDAAADASSAHAAAIALLARRDFSSGELRERLRSRGYQPEVVAAVLAQLVEEHLLDDARYAGHYVTYHAGRGQGPVRIAADLKAFGLPGELIDAALDAGHDWRAAARAARVRRFGPEPPEGWGEKARQSRFLQYRGFSADHIRAALGADFDPEE